MFGLCLGACICWILLKTSPKEQQGGSNDFQNQVGQSKCDDTVWGAGRRATGVDNNDENELEWI